MPHFERKCIVPFSALQMFELVNDVEAYPQFIPGCIDAQIKESSLTHMLATLVLSKAGIRYAFTTRNRLNNPLNRGLPLTIQMELDNGPFQSLTGQWQFVPKGNWCEIQFYIEFEFKQVVLNLTFGPVFKQVTESLIQSFKERAEVIYERASID